MCVFKNGQNAGAVFPPLAKTRYMNYSLRVIPTLKHYSDIVSDITSGSVYGMFILTFYLTCYLAFILTFFLTFYLAFILTYFLAYILTFFLTFYLVCLRRFFVVEVSWDHFHPAVAVRVGRGPLRSRDCSWGPADEEEEKEGSGTADIKSSNSHLTGGEIY